MPPSDDKERLSVNATGRGVVLQRRPQPTGPLQASPRPATLKHRVEQEAVPPSRPKAAQHRATPPTDLMEYCRLHMSRVAYPRTASDIVRDWYSAWRGHPDRPKDIINKRRTAGHVDRVSKWLERHERVGRLRVVDRKGKWNAKRYLQVDGANWKRPSRAKATKGSEISSEH